MDLESRVKDLERALEQLKKEKKKKKKRNVLYVMAKGILQHLVEKMT